MFFHKEKLKRLLRRNTGSPHPDPVAGEAAEDVEEPRPPPETHKGTKKLKAKSVMRTLSAIASHSFDVVRELSDAFGPLKGAVNGVGYAKDVWQNVRKIEKDARMLQSEVDSFRERVISMFPGDAMATAPVQVVNSLIHLDEQLNDVEAIVSILSKGRTKSRLLHWKEYDSQLKTAQARFQSSRDNFLVDCSITNSTMMFTEVSFRIDRHAQIVNDQIRQLAIQHLKLRDAKTERILKNLVYFGLFDCNG